MEHDGAHRVQAAATGGSFTYSSADSFGQGAQGAPAGSQYLATRTTSGWANQNITTPLLSGSYGSSPDGVPFQLFSGDLAFSLLSNGERCRECPGPDACPARQALSGACAAAYQVLSKMALSDIVAAERGANDLEPGAEPEGGRRRSG